MPGFPTQTVGTPANRWKARRYTIRVGTRARPSCGGQGSGARIGQGEPCFGGGARK